MMCTRYYQLRSIRSVRSDKMVLRKADKLENTGFVPYKDGFSDQKLISQGDQIDPYIHHLTAHYAYSYRGRLLSEYWRLVDLRDKDGSRLFQ